MIDRAEHGLLGCPRWAWHMKKWEPKIPISITLYENPSCHGTQDPKSTSDTEIS